jgi:hypothetical protein
VKQLDLEPSDYTSDRSPKRLMDRREVVGLLAGGAFFVGLWCWLAWEIGSPWLLMPTWFYFFYLGNVVGHFWPRFLLTKN